jgi:DNA-binding CsgD family transcriptional regulator
VSQNLAQKLAFDLEKAEIKPHERLSDREFEVLRLIGAGKSAHEIAEILSLSLNTVSTYRKRILEKMGMKSTSELIHYAVRNDLVI